MKTDRPDEEVNSYRRNIKQECVANGNDIYQYVLLKTRNRDLAEEITQEAIKRVIKYVNEHGLEKKIENVHSFLRMTAYHLLIDLETEKAHCPSTVELDDERNNSLLKKAVDETFAPYLQKKIEQQEIIQTFLKDATPLEQQVFKNLLEGRSYEEIADTISLKPAKIRLLVYKVLARLRYRVRNKLKPRRPRWREEHKVRLPKESKLEQLLLEEGLLSEIPPRIKDFTSYRNRRPVKVKGKPISETIIEERR